MPYISRTKVNTLAKCIAGSPAQSPGSQRRRPNQGGPSPLVLTGNGNMRMPHSPPVRFFHMYLSSIMFKLTGTEKFICNLVLGSLFATSTGEFICIFSV